MKLETLHQTPAERLVWTTRDGQRLPISEMALSHVFFTVRALFNSLAPPMDRVPGCRVYQFRLTPEKIRQFVSAFLDRLSRESEKLNPMQRLQLTHMATVCGRRSGNKVQPLELKHSDPSPIHVLP